MPIAFFPGCEETLAEIDDIDLAISFANPIILLDLIPAEGRNSNSVTMGPVLNPVTFPVTPKSLRVSSNLIAFS